ncbi:MAG: hypothetical protein U0R65_15790 [Candidatus Nanopelagicales bacterium]
MFGRRAGDSDVSAALTAAYPAAPTGVLEAALAADERPTRSDVAAWVDEQVLREAARRCAADAGLTDAPWPPDGEDALRVYLSDELTDADVDDVPASAWAAARDDAWTDHPDGLRSDRELWWADTLPAAALVDAWRT